MGEDGLELADRFIRCPGSQASFRAEVDRQERRDHGEGGEDGRPADLVDRARDDGAERAAVLRRAFHRILVAAMQHRDEKYVPPDGGRLERVVTSEVTFDGSGEEFRHPALATDRGTVPRRLGLLAAKLVVAAVTALLLAVLTVGCDAAVLHLVYGPELTEVPADWQSVSTSWITFMIGCAWAGVLAAGVFRSTTAGLAAVVAVPIVVVPLVQKGLAGPSARSAVGLPGRLRQLALVEWPFGVERYLAGGLRMVAQPVGGALALSVTALLCAYLLTATRNRAS